MQPWNRVLVTNGQLRKSLAAVRSLGRKGITVLAAEKTVCAPALFSKYCSKRLVYPDPQHEPDAFYCWLVETLNRYPCDVLYPMDDDVLAVIMAHRAELEKLCRLPIPSGPGYRIACDKAETAKHAQAAGVSFLKTVIIHDRAELASVRNELPYPVLVKPRQSNGARGIRKVSGPEELAAVYREVHEQQSFPIIQTLVNDAEIYDVALLYDRAGQLKAHFIMRHVRSFPIGRGPSSVQESVAFPEMLAMALRFMDRLQWRGMADLEFLRDRATGRIYFLEINPRFWNSLYVGILAGVDFPWLLYQIALGKEVAAITDYQCGLICRNLFPSDILHYLANPARRKIRPGFWDFGSYDLNDDIWLKDDPAAFLGFIAACCRYLFDREMWRFLIKR